MDMTKVVIIEFWKWLLANLFLPLIAPFVISLICLFGGNILGEMAMNSQLMSVQFYSELLDVLLVNGVYSFIGITFLISLFYDYTIASNTIKGLWLLLYACILLALGSLFIHSLGLVVGKTAYTPEERKIMFYFFSIFAVAFSVPFKIIIIRKKIKNDIYSNL